MDGQCDLLFLGRVPKWTREEAILKQIRQTLCRLRHLIATMEGYSVRQARNVRIFSDSYRLANEGQSDPHSSPDLEGLSAVMSELSFSATELASAHEWAQGSVEHYASLMN
jgi:hypothetical protein